MVEMNERRQDFELLQRFVRHGEQSAFADVVRRHLDLVFATALRKVEDAGAAQEVAQNVFSALARKAWRFAPDDSLPAWLHKTALLESKSWLRGELRRRRREETAAELGTTMKSPDDQPAFNALVPLLDEALLSLREKDRTALLLRFYESRSLRDVGTAFGISEDTAQKRVQGALEKLSDFFKRRGFKTATVAATVAALEHTAASASATMASAVVGAALHAAPPAMVGLAALIARLASLSKLQTAAACLLVAAGPVTWQWQARQTATGQAARTQQQLAALEAEQETIRTEIMHLRESSGRLEVETAKAASAEHLSASATEQYAAWKNRLRGLLTARDYRWPEDSPFVRIPKAALPNINPNQTISPPGIVDPAARELLGLTPQERETAEAALHDHFAGLDGLMEAKLYETNRVSHSNLPANAAASRIFVVPALGDAAVQQSEQLLSTLQTTLGEERWPLMAASLESHGTHTLRGILGLDAAKQSQELAVWINEGEKGATAGYMWGSANSTFSTSGQALASFLPGADSPTATAATANFHANNLPEVMTSRMLVWLGQQAVARTGKEKQP